MWVVCYDRENNVIGQQIHKSFIKYSSSLYFFYSLFFLIVIPFFSEHERSRASFGLMKMIYYTNQNFQYLFDRKNLIKFKLILALIHIEELNES